MDRRPRSFEKFNDELILETTRGEFSKKYLKYSTFDPRSGTERHSSNIVRNLDKALTRSLILTRRIYFLERDSDNERNPGIWYDLRNNNIKSDLTSVWLCLEEEFLSRRTEFKDKRGKRVCDYILVPKSLEKITLRFRECNNAIEAIFDRLSKWDDFRSQRILDGFRDDFPNDLEDFPQTKPLRILIGLLDQSLDLLRRGFRKTSNRGGVNRPDPELHHHPVYDFNQKISPHAEDLWLRLNEKFWEAREDQAEEGEDEESNTGRALVKVRPCREVIENLIFDFKESNKKLSDWITSMYG